MTNKRIKVEVFSTQKYKDLEILINSWLKNKQPEEIKNIHYSTSLAEGPHTMSSMYSALITYIIYE